MKLRTAVLLIVAFSAIALRPADLPGQCGINPRALIVRSEPESEGFGSCLENGSLLVFRMVCHECPNISETAHLVIDIGPTRYETGEGEDYIDCNRSMRIRRLSFTNDQAFITSAGGRFLLEFGVLPDSRPWYYPSYYVFEENRGFRLALERTTVTLVTISFGPDGRPEPTVRMLSIDEYFQDPRSDSAIGHVEEFRLRRQGR